MAVCQPRETRKRDILAVHGCYRPAHIQHKALSTGLQLDAVAPDLGNPAMDPRAHAASRLTR